MAGWFDFVNGQTLPASRVQDYLMDQSVMVFADDAARTAALPSPTFGMVTYLTSTGELYVRTGGFWRPIVDSLNYGRVLPTRRNAIINGGMDVWQRGTTFTGSNVYTADRWTSFIPAGGCTYTRETTIVPTGFAASIKLTQSGATGSSYIMQSIETANTIPLAGKTVTVSAFVYGGVSTSFTLALNHSSTVDRTPVSPFDGLVASSTATVGATWTRITATGTVPTTAKTLRLDLFANSLGVGQSVYFTGVQVEEGSVPTPFARNADSLQGELAACQRYYYRATSLTSTASFSQGLVISTNTVSSLISLPTTMRSAVSSIDFSALSTFVVNDGTAAGNPVSLTLAQSNGSNATITAVLAGMTVGRIASVYANGTTNAFIGFSAEL
jgi:hypothetical protein